MTDSEIIAELKREHIDEIRIDKTTAWNYEGKAV